MFFFFLQDQFPEMLVRVMTSQTLVVQCPSLASSFAYFLRVGREIWHLNMQNGRIDEMLNGNYKFSVWN